jgi:hypothetical protein
MRLDRLDHGHRGAARLMLAVMKRMGGRTPPDVVKLLFYRRGFFGRPYSAWLHDIMRGESSWTIGERELFAAYTSRLNQCLF